MWPDAVEIVNKRSRMMNTGGPRHQLSAHHSRNNHTLHDQQPTRATLDFPQPRGISHLAIIGLWQPIAIERSAVLVVWITKSHSFPLLAHTFIYTAQPPSLVISGCETMGNTLELDKSRTLHASGVSRNHCHHLPRAPSAIPQSAGEPVHAGHAGPALQPAVRPVLVQFLAGPACLLMADVGQVLRNTSQGHGMYQLHSFA
ncbi:hypothetical protein QR685DRAFT_575685 [Neurospora intermedia]|uniref:Uncharacterized protein n=1 Tax=Neurospora intermedia TaxID=5142 RepID=A0ABR3D2M5_NEUIN